MSRLDKHKAAHKAAMSRKKVQSNPLEEILRPRPDIPCLQCGSHLCCGHPEAPSPVGASRPIPFECKCGNAIEAAPGDKEVRCEICGEIWFPAAVAARPAPKRPQNSPTVRDERMRRKGRLPHGATITACYDAMGGEWFLNLVVGEKEFPVHGEGLHSCCENLWDRYCEWRDEQTEAAK